jgi:hypothetical protein
VPRRFATADLVSDPGESAESAIWVRRRPGRISVKVIRFDLDLSDMRQHSDLDPQVTEAGLYEPGHRVAIVGARLVLRLCRIEITMPMLEAALPMSEPGVV